MFSMSEANEPMALAGAGLSGSRLAVSPTEAAKRRGTMAMLLSNGLSNEEIARVMASEYQLDANETAIIREQVAETLVKESDRRKPYKKAMAEQRLHRHIASAAKRQAWGAVAQLEGQLARIQGTEEPAESRLTVDARLQSATLTVLGGMSPEQIEQLVASEVKRLPSST